MALVYISLGSNIEPARYVKAGVAALREVYGDLVLSSIYESAAVGFAGSNFYNLVAQFATTDSVMTVKTQLRAIEDAHQRVRTANKKFNARTLDLDLLLYDDLVIQQETLVLPRDEILKFAFVLLPLAEIAPQARHPETGQTYAALWDAMQPTAPALWKVELAL